MSHRKDADRLIKGLAQRAENPALALVENGRAYADLGGIVFAFSFDRERDCLYIQSHAGSLKAAQDPEAVLEALLQANHLWGGTAGAVLGLDEASGELGLAYRLDFPLVPEGEEFPEDLLVELMPHLAGVTQWCRDLADPAEAERE